MAQSPSLRITRGGGNTPSRLDFLPPLVLCVIIALTLLAIQSAVHRSPANMAVTTPALPVRSPVSASEAPAMPAALSAPVTDTPSAEPEPLYIPEYAPPLSWPLPADGYPINSLLAEVTENAAANRSTDDISMLQSGHLIPQNSRCARCVSSALHTYVPQFEGHDLADICSRLIETGLNARKSRVYRLQEQISTWPDGYLFVICFLKSSHSRVGHICFYDPSSCSAIGNSEGVWRTQTLDAFWPRYRCYYLLGVPAANQPL